MANVLVKFKGEMEPRTILNGPRAEEDVPADKLVVYNAADTIIARIDLGSVDSFWPEGGEEPGADKP